ncbi:hypothetical protein KKE06_04180, partial [Candidatus Micrarchaeota archaeon]|nr:hypothetical protein [Candidatus Micrarchaeota archaeon]
MAGKKNKWQKGLLFFLFFFLAQTAWAQLSVSIEPQNPVHEIALYSNEVADFKLLVINLSSERIVGQQFQLLASEGIVLLEQNQEKKNQSFLVPELLPDQAIELFFVIKAKESGESVLSVNFGNYVFSDLVAKRIRIVHSLLQ